LNLTVFVSGQDIKSDFLTKLSMGQSSFDGYNSETLENINSLPETDYLFISNNDSNFTPTNLEKGINKIYSLNVPFINVIKQRNNFSNLKKNAKDITLNTMIGDTIEPTVFFNNLHHYSRVSNQISVQIQVTDNVAVNRVELYIDQTLISSQNVSPSSPNALVSFAWNTSLSSNGKHMLKAKAFDTSGNVAIANVSVITRNFSPPPPPPPPPTGNVIYVATNGSPTGDGSISNPLDLQTAINQPTSVVPGTTIYLRGGTYKGRYISSLVGDPNNPITVRSYPGEWARIDGYKTATLTTPLPAVAPYSNSTITLSNQFGIPIGSVIIINNEHMQTNAINGNQITVVRGWDGTTPVTHGNGSTLWVNGNVFNIYGRDTIYRDFEILDANPNRSFATIATASDRKGGVGIYVYGKRTKLINLIVHDAQDGVFFSENSEDTEAYGVITYNNGHIDPVRGHGHGLYIQNRLGQKQIKNITSFNNFAYGMKAFGENGTANNIHFDGIVSFNNSSPAAFPNNPAGYESTHRFVNIFVGTANTPPQNISVKNSYLYHSATSVSEYGNLGLGFVAQGGQGLTVTNNHIMGGQMAVQIGGFNDFNFSGNHLLAYTTLASVLTPGNPSAYTWNNNSYYDLAPVSNAGNTTYPFEYNNATNRFGGGRLTYDDTGTSQGKGWKQWTGYDTNSSYVRSKPDGLQVFIRPNQYQSGRATIIVYNWNQTNNFSVNLSPSGLTNGQKFEIRNVQDYFSTPLISNQTYSSNMSVSLPLNNLSVAAPIGLGFTPSSTCPEFCVFEVVPLNN
jgi:hypothetical protein